MLAEEVREVGIFDARVKAYPVHSGYSKSPGHIRSPHTLVVEILHCELFVLAGAGAVEAVAMTAVKMAAAAAAAAAAMVVERRRQQRQPRLLQSSTDEKASAQRLLN